jgi:hypothetical protein
MFICASPSPTLVIKKDIGGGVSPARVGKAAAKNSANTVRANVVLNMVISFFRFSIPYSLGAQRRAPRSGSKSKVPGA